MRCAPAAANASVAVASRFIAPMTSSNDMRPSSSLEIMPPAGVAHIRETTTSRSASGRARQTAFVRTRDGGVRRAPIVVGREVELDRMRRAVHDAVAGHTRCLFVVGEAGVGKTRLLAEVAGQARGLGLAGVVGAGAGNPSTPL